MAKAKQAPKAAPVVAATPAPTAPVAAPVASANPFQGMVAQATAAPAVAPKVHALAVNGATFVAANHVATFKGVKGVPANIAGHSYTIGAKVYAPAQGHINAVQWAAVNAAMAENGGKATVAQIAAAFTAAGLAAGLAPGFVAYRAKAGSLATA